MAFTWDPGDISTDRAKMRMLIRDTNSDYPIFTDEEIVAMLAIEGDNLKRGSALAWETIAGNEAYVQKVITLLDLATNGAQTARVLLERAALLRKQAADEEANEDGGAFDIAEWVVDSFTARERLYAQTLRD